MKTITHVFAVGIVAVAGFFVSPAGVSLLHQYPVLVPVAAGIGALAALYHSPKVGA
jgi:hypothetical protein